jgi:starch synthase
VLPDYGTFELGEGARTPLDMPPWVGITTYRRGTVLGGVPVIAVRTPAIERPHPYNDELGHGWHDNDFRFMAFSAAVAELTKRLRPDVLHLNDWHTGAALGFLDRPVPSVLTIHNLAYQGPTHAGWLDVLHHRPGAYEWHGGANPLSGAIALADYVVAVSPNYAEEIRHPEHGAGLDAALRAKGDRLVGILNGIDPTWNPGADPHLPAPYSATDLAPKSRARRELLAEIGWPGERSPLLAMVTRLTWQKGVDLALDIVDYLGRVPARLVVLGSGDRQLADRARWMAFSHPDRLLFIEGFDEPLAHRIFGGADLLVMPSRFEPCGLAQMQAMAYGTIPVVTDVGGLHDTVVDEDERPDEGTGFVAPHPTPVGLLDAVHRAARAWRAPQRRRAIQLRGMARDWSWTEPAERQIEIYRSL